MQILKFPIYILSVVTNNFWACNTFQNVFINDTAGEAIHDTVRSRYIAAIFRRITYERHPIARP